MNRRTKTSPKLWIVTGVILALFILPSAIFANQGIGFSYFLPKEGEGGLGLGFGLELGFSKLFSVIPRINYFEFDGLHTNDEYCNSGWFKTKSLIIDIMGKLELALGPIHPYALFGGAAIGNLQLKALEGNIDRDFLKNSDLTGENKTLTTNFTYDNKIGFGYQIGGGIKIFFKKFGINAGARIYKMKTPIHLRGTYVEADETTNAVVKTYDNPESKILIDGILISVGFIIKK